VIHAHFWLSGIAALPVALELGVPFVQSFHTLASITNSRMAPGDTSEPHRRVMSEKYLASQADAIVASSAFEATSLIDELATPPRSVWVVPPGVDLSHFSPLRPASDSLLSVLRIDEGRAVLALVARLQPLKGHELALRALAALPRPRPLLAIAGAQTPGSEGYVSQLRALVAELGLDGDVRFLGALDRDDIASLLARADMTLIPSHSETFGLVALESAASGTPVVAALSTGLVESVSPGESGVLIESREPSDWATVIFGILAEPHTLRTLSTTARVFGAAAPLVAPCEAPLQTPVELGRECSDNSQDCGQIIARGIRRCRGELGYSCTEQREVRCDLANRGEQVRCRHSEWYGRVLTGEFAGVENVEIDVHVHGGGSGRCDRLNQCAGSAESIGREGADGVLGNVVGFVVVDVAHAGEHDEAWIKHHPRHELGRTVARERPQDHSAEGAARRTKRSVEVGVGIEPHDGDVTRCSRGTLRCGLFENVAYSAEFGAAIATDREGPVRRIGATVHSVAHPIANECNGTAARDTRAEFDSGFEGNVDDGRGRSREVACDSERAIHEPHGSRR
jgi:hypothetical protein